MTKNAKQGMNGVENDMYTAQQNRRPSGIAHLLRATIFGLALTLGLTLGNGAAQAEEGDRDTRQVQRNDREQADDKKDSDKKDDKAKRDDRDHANDSQPTLTLTAPASGSVKLYPAAFELDAAVSFPGKAGSRNDQREGITIEFLADGQKFAEAQHPPYRASYTPPRAGIYTLSARISYGEGKRTILSDAITVVSNIAPSVSLTAPAANASYTAPSAISFNATAADSDGTIAKVEFYNGATLLGTATAAPYSYTWNDAPVGTYTLTAVATDNLGAATTSAAATVTVIAPPVVSLSGPVNNAVVTAPATFTLTADASSAGSIAKVEFYNGTTLIGSTTTAPYTFTWTNVSAGSYSITAVATDGNGATSTSAPASVIANAAPVVSITAPVANSIVAAPASFTLTADATDSDGTIAKVDFYNGTTLIGTATAAPYSFDWTNVPAGVYTITAVATDNAGAQTTSAAVAVTSNQLPTITLTDPADGAQITSPNSFNLTADAADADGSIAKVEFYNGTTLLGTATTAPYSVTWANVPVGNYSLTAIATDNHGGQTSSSAISVTAIANVPPTVSLTGPANGTTMKVPGNFTLTADAASTTSAIAKVDFYAIDNATNAGMLIGTVTQVPYTANWSNVPLGDYTLSAVATDTLNAVTTSSQVSVTVNTGMAQAYYIHTDHLDTPRTITDTQGNTVWQWDNTDPFGSNMADENPNGAGQFNFNLRFPGQYFDKETGLHYNFYRDGYNPAIGAYTQFDPIGLAGGINGYVYALSNPLSFIDPTGLDITVSFDGGAAILAGHVGMGVNSPNTVGQRPQPGQNPLAVIAGQNVPGQISPDHTPDTRVVIPTTPQQDQQAQQCIDTRTREQQNYNLYQNNCAQFVGQCLRAAGVPVPDTQYPRTLFNNLQRRFGGDQ